MEPYNIYNYMTGALGRVNHDCMTRKERDSGVTESEKIYYNINMDIINIVADSQDYQPQRYAPARRLALKQIHNRPQWEMKLVNTTTSYY